MNELSVIGNQIKWLDEVDSTNNYTTGLCGRERLTEGQIFAAERQIAGRGMGSNSWVSKPNQNLTFSVYLEPLFLSVIHQFQLSKAIALGLRDYLSEFSNDVKIKWPNDLLIGNKKIAGILIENSISGERLVRSVVGIGLNVNQSDFEGLQATSLSLETGNTFELEVELIKLSRFIDARYWQLRNRSKKIDEDYLKCMFAFDEDMIFVKDEIKFNGVVRGVDQIGRLKIETTQGVKFYNMKEVKFVF